MPKTDEQETTSNATPEPQENNPLLKSSDLWIVQPLIGRGHNTLIYGQQGSGKSWLAWFIAKAVSEDIPLLGKFHTTKGRCIIYDEETPLTDLSKRRDLVFGQQSQGRPVAEIYDLPNNSTKASYLNELATKGIDVLIYPQGSFSLGRGNPARRLIEDTNLFDVDLVILDNLNAMQGNLKIEKDNWAVGKVRDIFKQVKLSRKNLTIIIIHHEGKLKEGGPRGSSAILDMADTAIRLGRLQDTPLQFIVQQMARKRPAYVTPFIVQLSELNNQLDLTFIEEVTQGDVEVPTDDAVDIAAYIRLRPDESHTVKSIRDATLGRFSERTIRDELNNLEKNGFLDVGRESHNQFRYRLIKGTSNKSLYSRVLLKKLEDKGVVDLGTKSKAEGEFGDFPLEQFICLREISSALYQKN